MSSIVAKPVRSERPTDDLGELADYMLTMMEKIGGGEKMRAVVFLENDERCMTALHGWESDLDAAVAVLVHLKAVFEANGKTLMLMPLRQG